MIQALFKIVKKAISILVMSSFNIKLHFANSIYLSVRLTAPYFATTIGLISTIILMYQHIRQVTGLNQTILFKRSLLIGILTAVMTL